MLGSAPVALVYSFFVEHYISAMSGAVLLGLTVTNIGILFRLRLQFVVPLIVIAATYGAAKSALATRLASPSLSGRANR